MGRRVDISNKPPQGFEVLPKRWIVERTLAWLGGFRRLAKNFEILTTSAENMIRIAIIKVTLAKCI
jgi:putative transposase